MEEIKSKILGLLNKQPPKIPSMGFSDSNYHFNQVQNLSINSKTATEYDRPADQDILESIQAAYFSMDESYDICRFELGKLPEVLDCDQIQSDFKTLKQQHQVVSKKVLQMILEHQNSCNDEFNHIMEVLETVKVALKLCQNSRKELSVVKKEYSECLTVLANYRKRQLAQNVLDILKMIKNLYNFEKRLNVLLNEGDYVGAILELQQCQKIANKYRYFTCVSALTYKIQETIENTDSQLDRILSQTCYHFNGDHYSKLQAAYSLLDKTQISMIDNLHVHYITAIFNSSINVVQSFVDKPGLISNDTSGTNPYKTLCQSVPQEVFIPCLVQLCKTLFKIVLSYHQLIAWYNGQEAEPRDDEDKELVDKEKLNHYLVKIWDDVQRKVSSLLLNAELAGYKFDQFVIVLNIVNRLIQVGEEFCSSKSEDLLESIRKQSANYFKNYHSARLEELRIWMENEMWEMCPVKTSFMFTQLQEFKSLRSIMRNFKTRAVPVQSVPAYSTGSTDCCSSTHSQDGSSIFGNLFIRFTHDGTPFDSGLDETIIVEDILLDDNDASGYFSDDSNDECDQIFKDEYLTNGQTEKVGNKDKKVLKTPILTNTSLSILRQMGKYLQMSRLLKPIAYKIIMSMNELFDYYLYAVHDFFASDLTIPSRTLYTEQLNMTLNKIADNMILNQNSEKDARHVEDRILKPNISPAIDLKKPEQLHGLSERIVAVESLIYLANQFLTLQDFMEFLIPQNNKFMLGQFFEQSVNSAADLRKPVYMTVACQAFDLRQIMTMMGKINWEVRDVMSQHNSYVDMLLREVQIFTLRLETIAAKIPISEETYFSLWENVAHIITHTLVQGFSEAKKCTNGGRALMQLDFTQFMSKFEKISSLKPIPHRSYVENYVKAYYLPEYELEKWIKEHNEYSTKHMQGLISCVCQNNKMRQRLMLIVEDLEKNSSDR